MIPILAPSPITAMATGLLRQMALWRGARPGILLQIMLAPKATTDDSALKENQKEDCHSVSQRVTACHNKINGLNNRAETFSFINHFLLLTNKTPTQGRSLLKQ